MNRAERRHMAKLYRHAGLTKEQAKATANQYLGDEMKEGDKVRFNFELMVRHPQWKLQKDEFKEWAIAHKNDILTVAETKDNGKQVTFVEDENEEKFWHKTVTLIPVATATIKLDDGTETKVVLDGVTDMNDPKIMEEVNKVLEE